MIFNLEVSDECLKFLHQTKNKQYNYWILDRWNKDHCDKYSLLAKLGIIENSSSGGEGCYNPSFHLTDVGKLVFQQYKETVGAN